MERKLDPFRKFLFSPFLFCFSIQTGQAMQGAPSANTARPKRREVATSRPKRFTMSSAASSSGASSHSRQHNDSKGAVEFSGEAQYFDPHDFPHGSVSPSRDSFAASKPSTSRSDGLVHSPKVGAVSKTASNTSSVVTGSAKKKKRTDDEASISTHASNLSPQRSSQSLREKLSQSESQLLTSLQNAVSSNQMMLDHIAQRRQRSEMLCQWYKDEIRDSELEIARQEQLVKDLQLRRKELIDENRTLELDVYQQRKNALQQPTSKKPEISKPRAPQAQPPAHSFASDDAAYQARLEYENLNRRLDIAKSLAKELQNECAQSQQFLFKKQQERETILSMVEEVSKDVEDLERHEIFVGAVVRESKEAIQSAGWMASRIPYVERMLAEYHELAVSLRSDFDATQAWIARRIKLDDETVDNLRGVSNALQLSDNAGSCLPTLVRQLQSENDEMQQQTHSIVEQGERERLKLQKVADSLLLRLQNMEEKIRVTEASAGRLF